MAQGSRTRAAGRLGFGLVLFAVVAGCHGTGKHIDPTQPILPSNKDAPPPTAGAPGAKASPTSTQQPTAARTATNGQRTPVVQNTGFARPPVEGLPPQATATGTIGVPTIPTTGGTLTPTPPAAVRTEPLHPVPVPSPTPEFKTPQITPVVSPEPPAASGTGVLPPMPPSQPGATAGVPVPPTAGPAGPTISPPPGP